jgi:hypothetical protein
MEKAAGVQAGAEEFLPPSASAELLPSAQSCVFEHSQQAHLDLVPAAAPRPADNLMPLRLKAVLARDHIRLLRPSSALSVACVNPGGENPVI